MDISFTQKEIELLIWFGNLQKGMMIDWDKMDNVRDLIKEKINPLDDIDVVNIP